MRDGSAYINIISALGDAQRYASAMDDIELKARIREIEAIAIDRLYSARDREAKISITTPKMVCRPSKRRERRAK
jgi:hypothetical protein